MSSSSNPSGALRLATAVGAVVTASGYQSRVVDQCYRLPIVTRMRDSTAFANDPFVQAFDTFNPHLGYGKLIIGVSSIIGDSAALFVLHIATLALAIWSIFRIRESLFPELPRWSDWVLISAFVLCRAGNIGTNHLWEDHLLDRQIGYSLLWFALAEWIGGRERRFATIPLTVGLMAIVHPGLGVLTAALWTAVFGLGALLSSSSLKETVRFGSLLAIVMIPWAILYLPQSKTLTEGIDSDLFWSLATELQGPQHMRPVHWREPQWWAALTFLVIGAGGLFSQRSTCNRPASKRALHWALPIIAGLALAVILIEAAKILPVALAQPFRLATPLRGLCLIASIPWITNLIRTGSPLGAARAGALLLSLRSDRAFQAAVSVELVMIAVDRVSENLAFSRARRVLPSIMLLFFGLLATFWLFLKDTADGEILVAGGYVSGGLIAYLIGKIRDRGISDVAFLNQAMTSHRARRICMYAWMLPFAAIFDGSLDPRGDSSVSRAIVARWRVQEIPVSDMERLAVESRTKLAPGSLVLAPPRDKSFRSWSGHSVVVNVAGSPYQARALADWAERLRVVAGEPCDLTEFSRRWPENRFAWETHYEKADAGQLDAWAARFGANAIVTKRTPDKGPTLDSFGWQAVVHEGAMTLWARRDDLIARSESSP
jgi:hypothetical protein